MKLFSFILKDTRQDHAELLQWQNFILDWERQEKYAKKLSYYKKILQKTRSESLWYEYSSPVICDISSVPIEIGSQFRSLEISLKKETLLERLVTLSQQLTNGRDRNLEAEFIALEAQVKPFITDADDYFASYTTGPEVLIARKSDHVTFAYARVKILLRKLYSSFFQDRREMIRALRRFLFKNMDDEAHLNVVVAQTCKTSFIQKTSSKWRRNRYSMS